MSPNSNNELKAITVLFAALISGVIIFALVSVLINQLQGPLLHDANFHNGLLIAVALLAIILTGSAHAVYKNKMKQAKQANLSLSEKLNIYRAALITYLALCEAPALLAIISFLLTGDFLFGLVAGFALLNMFLKRPAKSRLANELELDSAEQSQLL